MPFRSEGRTYWKTRVSLPDGREIIAGCGTDDRETALAVERMVTGLRRKRQFAALEMIVDRKAKLSAVFDAYERGELDAFITQESQDDLAKLLDEWTGNPKSRTQIRRMIGESFPAGRFTRKSISEFLASLPVGPATKNRYRAALSVFARWLVEREVLEHNPVRDVRGQPEQGGRVVWLEREQAKALIGALDYPHRAIEALMAATGVEWQVIERLRGRAIDFGKRRVHAEGGKTAWRNRIVRATELWAWEIFAEYARDFTNNALIFAGIREDAALRKHKRASRLLGLPHTTLHDWRHTYAVQALRDGYKPAVVAHQLGHRDSYLVLTRYGRFVPDDSDFQIHAAAPAFQAEGRDA